MLGPLEVEASGAPVRFDGAKQRTLFVFLALHAPEPVSADALLEALWGADQPSSAMQALQKQISRLRSRLGDATPVHHRASGYALEIDTQAIDSRRFEELLKRARIALGRDEPEQASSDLREALALWRGAPLPEHQYDEFAQHEIARLVELHAEAIEERLAAELAEGHEADLVGELQALVAEYPLRERLRGQLMIALYRTGRQAEALETMRQARELLVDQLGIEPGPELRRLERMILAHDPELMAARPAAGIAPKLPAAANETIGRDRELADIGEHLLRPTVRLLTLVGPGGVGKTRLAMEAARSVAPRFPGGAVHVNLDGSDDADVLVPEAAAALGVVASTPAELGEQLSRATGGAPALLVFDGFDRFLEDAEQVGALLASVPNLTVLATGKAPLRITAEHVFRVQPLAAPNAAVLFVERARAASPAWDVIEPEHELVGAIVSRLDGLPLAIELAADRARLLPPPALLERLDNRLEVLTEGPRDLPLRQRSLRATLEWSWEALAPPERVLLGRLTLFEGGASLEAARAVFDGEPGGSLEGVVVSLVDKSSLLRTDSGRDAQPRFRMLDTVREFAAERVSDLDELPVLERRHADYFLVFCENAAAQAARTDRREWLDRLAEERGNIRLAFERLMRAGAVDAALRIAIAFARALPWDAHANEVRGWLAQGLGASVPASPRRRADALYWDGRLALSQGRFRYAEARLDAAAAAAREAGERAVEAAALAAQGRRAVLVAEPEAAALCDRAVTAAREVGDPILVADALLMQAGACERTQEWERAGELAGEALVLYRAAGDPYGAATALAEQGWYDMVHGRLDSADRRLSEALDLRRLHGDDRRLVEPLIDHAWLLLVRHESEEAAKGFEDCLRLARQVDDQFNVGEALAGFSTLAALDGRAEDAAMLAGASASIHDRIGAPPWESVTAIQDEALARARDSIGTEGFTARFRDGCGLSAEDALARTWARSAALAS